jgi:hypothetical protein
MPDESRSADVEKLLADEKAVENHSKFRFEILAGIQMLEMKRGSGLTGTAASHAVRL